jgi:hypothetical protein
MSAFGGFATPGFGAAAYTTEREILWGRDDQHLPLLFRNSIISGATRDAGNMPTTLLRRGLLLGKVDASGELEEWDADASDGTQNIAAVLNCELRATDFDANNTDRAFATILRAPVIAAQLLIQGSAFVGHIDEYLARRQMHAMGFVFDDDPQGFKAGFGNRTALVTGTSDTLTADENGTRLLYDNAAAVAVTLPALKAGLTYDIVRVGDEEIVVSSAEGDNIIVGNDLSADSITFTTAGNHIGAYVRVEGIYVGTTLKWLMTVPHVPLGTGLAFHAYALGT